MPSDSKSSMSSTVEISPSPLDASELSLALRPRLRAPGSRTRVDEATSDARKEGARIDAQLMVRVRMGDLEAFGDLIDRHKNPLVNYLAKLTHCRDRAEELAQESFLRIFESAARYRERGVFSAYLFRIATNLLRSEERRSQRWRGLTSSVSWHQEHAQSTAEPTPQWLALSGEATSRVSRALSELPLHYRAPLVLREIEGCSYAEIATSLQCREGTVKSRINRAKAQLRELLRPYWEGADE